jgi:sugar phosphate isomerase/epimerase
MVIEGHVDPRLAIEELGPYLRHVHVKNVAWRRERGAWRWRHAPLAEGMLDWAAIVGELARARYGGRLSLDHLGGRASVAVLRREVDVLRALLSH